MDRRQSLGRILAGAFIPSGLFSRLRADSHSKERELAVRVKDAADMIRGRTLAEIANDSHVTAPVLSDVIERVASCIAPGTTTKQINDLLSEGLLEHSLVPSMLGYSGFPAASAVSVSPAFLHAPPSGKMLSDGDLVTIQFSASSQRSHASQGWTVPVGAISSSGQAVIAGCAAALERAISVVQAGITTSDISNEIQSTLDERSLHPIRDFVGYSMGQERIQYPNIFGFSGRFSGESIREGMILNIHVFATTGSGLLRVSKDNWTSSLSDGEPAALATAMVLVRANDGVELTHPINPGSSKCNVGV